MVEKWEMKINPDPTWAPQKILCFGQPNPTNRNQPTLDFFCHFVVGVFIIKVSEKNRKKQQKADPT